MEFLKKNWILVLIFVMVIYLFYNQYKSNARIKKQDVKPKDEKPTTPPPRFGTVHLNDIKPETTPQTKG